MNVLWSILIASVYERRPMLMALLGELGCQLRGREDEVEVLVARDRGVEPIGSKRTRLIEGASGEYVCFIDDDDWVHPGYVTDILIALADRPDYVGFRVRYTFNGVEQKPVIHRFDCGGWSETPEAYLRDISHLNPIRRDIAKVGLPFQPGHGEDAAWGNRVRASGLIKHAVFVDAPLYEYRYSTSGSLFR